MAKYTTTIDVKAHNLNCSDKPYLRFSDMLQVTDYFVFYTIKYVFLSSV